MASQKGIAFRQFDFSRKPDLKIDLIQLIRKNFMGFMDRVDESKRWIWQPSLDGIKALSSAFDDPENIVLHHFTVAPEIIYAMGLKPLCLEALSFLAPVEHLCAYVDESRSAYVPDHLCSFISGWLGMLHLDIIPKPSAIIHCTQPCDNTVAAGAILADHYDTEMFVLDTPYYDTDEAHEYYAQQIKQAFKYLERMTGKKLDIDRFREVMERSHRAYELLHQINELKKRRPCPIPANPLLRQTSIAMYGLTGTLQLVEWLETHLADARMRVEKGIGGTYEERIRVVWNMSWPIFDWAIYEWMEKEYGAISVAYQSAEPFYMPRDISSADFDQLCKALAIRNLNSSMGRQGRGHFEGFIRDSVYWCREWGADACIFAGHLQCQANWSAAQICKEVLMDELGIPTLIFTVDQVDPRVASQDQMVAKLEPFLEMVSENMMRS